MKSAIKLYKNFHKKDIRILGYLSIDIFIVSKLPQSFARKIIHCFPGLPPATPCTALSPKPGSPPRHPVRFPPASRKTAR